MTDGCAIRRASLRRLPFPMRHHIQPLHLVLALLVTAAGACGSSSEGLRQERRADVVYLLGGPAGAR